MKYHFHFWAVVWLLLLPWRHHRAISNRNPEFAPPGDGGSGRPREVSQPSSYRQLQASTYNRSSVARDQPDQTFGGWFGDGDGGFYIRTENTNSSGATEYVVMDYTGPGAITKLWTPFFYQDFNNRTGPKIRIYLNGSNIPVIDENLIELVTRLEWNTANTAPSRRRANSFTVPAPIANFTARAGDCYLPIPFASSCKVTMSGLPVLRYRQLPRLPGRHNRWRISPRLL